MEFDNICLLCNWLCVKSLSFEAVFGKMFPNDKSERFETWLAIPVFVISLLEYVPH